MIDRRAISMTDVPFSAYCKTCWQAVYVLWADREPHDSCCPFGAASINDCQQAMDFERVRGAIAKYRAFHK